MTNPPDQYTFYKQTTDPTMDLANLNAIADAGYTKAEAVLTYPSGTYILLSGYKGQ